MRTLRVLLVDDDPMNLEVGQLVLKSASIDVTTASNGAEAVAACTDGDQCFDLILMDHNMPVMDGRTAIARLRANEATRDIPIIMVTGSSSGEDRQQALDAGADRYFTKPFRRKQLLDAIATVLVSKGVMAPGESLSD